MARPRAAFRADAGGGACGSPGRRTEDGTARPRAWGRAGVPPCTGPRRATALALLLLATVAAGAALAGTDAPCPASTSEATRPLDWSDGRYRVCSPPGDRGGHDYPPTFRMHCTVFVDAVPVGSAVVGPGQRIEGPHGRTGRGIATARCDTLDGRRGALAAPREVELSRVR